MRNEEIILAVVNQYKVLFKDTMCANAGKNGKYNMRETPIRNTSHWIISFSCAYKLTGDAEYLSTIENFGTYLKEQVEASSNGAVCCMPDRGAFNKINGLIGQAWLIEGLVKAGEILNDNSYFLAAQRVFYAQKYNSKSHLWDCIEVDGKNLGEDVAFNHHLWFAMSGFMLERNMHDSELKNILLDFMNNIGRHFLVYKSGLLSHFTVGTSNLRKNMRIIIVKHICELIGTKIPGKFYNRVEYERAYHLFSIYAFATIYQYYPELSFFKSEKWKKISSYGLNYSNFLEFNHCNDYAYHYNSPAFEYPYVAKILSGKCREEIIEELMKQQLSETYDKDKHDFSKNTIDANTLNARVYEYMQYLILCKEEKNGK